MVWGPSLPSEDQTRLLQCVETCNAAGYSRLCLIINGPSADEARSQLVRKVAEAGLWVEVLSLPIASIGGAQMLAMHRFLEDRNAKILVRIDPDGQFPVSCITDLLDAFELPSSPDVVMGQRDEAGIAGGIRFVGNVLLRTWALCIGISGDPNCGFYAMNRHAAAVLTTVPPTRYPEPRMLAAFRDASVAVETRVVPTLPRERGSSSIRGILRSLGLFVGSALEMIPIPSKNR